MINIEDAKGLAKLVINYIVIIIINCYQTIVSKIFYLIKIDIRDTFLINWYLENSLDIRYNSKLTLWQR